MMPGKEKVFGILQTLFAVQFVVYCVNYMTEMLSVTVVLVTEHLLMAATIGLVLYIIYYIRKIRINSTYFENVF